MVDRNTGLMWQKAHNRRAGYATAQAAIGSAGSDFRFTRREAPAYCEGLSLDRLLANAHRIELKADSMRKQNNNNTKKESKDELPSKNKKA